MALDYPSYLCTVQRDELPNDISCLTSDNVFNLFAKAEKILYGRSRHNSFGQTINLIVKCYKVPSIDIFGHRRLRGVVFDVIEPMKVQKILNEITIVFKKFELDKNKARFWIGSGYQDSHIVEAFHKSEPFPQNDMQGDSDSYIDYFFAYLKTLQRIFEQAKLEGTYIIYLQDYA